MQDKRSMWKTQFERLPSSSSYHETVRNILATDPYFRNIKCFQEVPVSSINPTYRNNLHKIDWLIDTLGVVLEIHGEQHYRLTNFGGIPYEEAVIEFNRGKYRDSIKKSAIEEVEYTYREIPYSIVKYLDGETLKRIIFYGEI